MMHPRTLLLATAFLVAAQGARAEPPTTFDGTWNITMTCPPHSGDDDAKGYTHRFPGEVTKGELRAVHGAEGEPGWHLVTGTIAADGSATLRVEGIVNNAAYAINGAPRGKAYRYRVKASFEASSGSGERLTGRTCHFGFAR